MTAKEKDVNFIKLKKQAINKKNFFNIRGALSEDESSLEDINNDHLGKLITYASGKSADDIVWVVKGLSENSDFSPL